MNKKLINIKNTAQLAVKFSQENNLSDEETIKHFISNLKEQHITLNNWFNVDNDLLRYETENWFWIIRRIRNNYHLYEKK